MYPLSSACLIKGHKGAGACASYPIWSERQGIPWTSLLEGKNETDNYSHLELPDNQICMSLDCERKLEYPERTHKATGKTHKLHTERPQMTRGFKPKKLLVWGSSSANYPPPCQFHHSHVVHWTRGSKIDSYFTHFFNLASFRWTKNIVGKGTGYEKLFFSGLRIDEYISCIL